MNYWQESKQNIYVAAHRGWCDQYPENTMSAFRAAIDLGVDQLETDVRVTKDGELVLIHDATVDRTTNGTGRVCEFTLAELRSLDAGNGERIPTLTELMELVKDHPTLTLDLELKEYPTKGWEETAFSVCDRILKTVDDYGFTDRVVINSFSGALQEYVFQKYGKKYRQHVFFPISNMGKTTLNPYDYAFCCCMFRTWPGAYNIAEKADCEKMTALGVEPWAGAGIKDAAGVELAIDRGVTLITCNNPDVILDELRKRGYHS